MITKQFEEQIIALSKRGVDQAEALRVLGFVAVRKAYNNNPDFCQYMLDTLVQSQRKPLFAWFKRAGINVESPVAGSARYMVQGIVDSKRQEKAFKFCESTQVIDLAHKITKEIVDKPLTGTAMARAVDALTSKIKSLRDKDPEGACALNELAQKPVMGLYLEDGSRMLLSHEEIDHLIGTITLLRMEIGISQASHKASDDEAIQAEIAGIDRMMADGLISQASYDKALLEIEAV